MVVLDDEPLEDAVELREREGRRADGLSASAVVDVPGQVRQLLAGDGAEEPLDLAAALRDADPGVDQADVWVSRQTSSSRALVKSLPWSLQSTSGRPVTGQAGLLLRPAAWCSASAVCSALGSPRKTV